MKTQIEIAQEIAQRVHANQTDRGGHPYLDHVRRVAGMATNERQFILGLLHDVQEDSGMSSRTLRRLGLCENHVCALVYLHHFKDETYDEYIDIVAGCRLIDVIQVKLNDNADNMRLDRLKPKDRDTSKTRERMEKYAKVRKRLMAAKRELTIETGEK